MIRKNLFVISFVLTILVLFLSAATNVNAFDIEPSNRISNTVKDGYCAWACLESLGRQHGIKSLHGLLEDRKNGKDIVAMGTDGKEHTFPRNLGYDVFIKQKLKELKVDFESQGAWNKDVKILEKNAKARGCVVVMMMHGGSHAIVLTDFSEKSVEFFDPNNKDFTTRATREWFDSHWYGITYVLK